LVSEVITVPPVLEQEFTCTTEARVTLQTANPASLRNSRLEIPSFSGIHSLLL
jgi:hypothetical protein